MPNQILGTDGSAVVFCVFTAMIFGVYLVYPSIVGLLCWSRPFRVVKQDVEPNISIMCSMTSFQGLNAQAAR